MRGTRAILAAALLTGLPVAAHAQGAHAPADAFLYIIWPPDGTTLKGAFWCRFGLRNMGITQAGSNAPTSHADQLRDVARVPTVSLHRHDLESVTRAASPASFMPPYSHLR